VDKAAVGQRTSDGGFGRVCVMDTAVDRAVVDETTEVVDRGGESAVAKGEVSITRAGFGKVL
jgi:hypothetical protein